MSILRQSTGDTIVEVLIALAVLGSVLVGGYSIATRSINSVRVSQERSEALKIAEGQMEQLRVRLSGVSTLAGPVSQSFEEVFIKNDDFIAPRTFRPAETQGNIRGFCFDESDRVVYFDNADPTLANSYTTTPRSDCLRDGRYRIVIVPRYDYTESKRSLALGYTVTVRWDRSGGGNEESLNLSYKTNVGGVTLVD